MALRSDLPPTTLLPIPAPLWTHTPPLLSAHPKAHPLLAFSNQAGSGRRWSVHDVQLFFFSSAVRLPIHPALLESALFYLFCGVPLHFNEKGTVVFPIRGGGSHA